MNPGPVLIMFVGLLLAPLSWAQARATATAPGEARSNVLLVILDDVGLDAVGCYPGATDDALTPEIDALAAGGLRFDTVWAYPACSPTRATILTGQYGFRTGIGSVVRLRDGDPGLGLDEVCMPEHLKAISPSIRTAFLGKWHLAGAQHGLDHALLQGFDHFRGTVGNLGSRTESTPYFAYNEILDGVKGRREAYATTAVTDDALAAIERFGQDPWLVVASYHAAHTPLHAPPEELRTTKLSGSPKASRHEHFIAMVEALDHEVGRLWSSLPDETRKRTTILIVGDNGGASAQMADEIKEARGDGRLVAGKGSLGEPGVRVPLIVAGAAVVAPGRTVAHVAGSSDVHDTVVELMLQGKAAAALAATPDSVSLVPYLRSHEVGAQRPWIFAERFLAGNEEIVAPPVDRFAMRDKRFKLIEDAVGGTLRFYDLEADPYETVNLLKTGGMTEEAIASLARFTAALAGPFGRDRQAHLASLR